MGALVGEHLTRQSGHVIFARRELSKGLPDRPTARLVRRVVDANHNKLLKYQTYDSSEGLKNPPSPRKGIDTLSSALGAELATQHHASLQTTDSSGGRRGTSLRSNRLRPKALVEDRAASLARRLFRLYPQLGRMPRCATAAAFAERVRARLRRAPGGRLPESQRYWRAHFRRSGGRDEGTRLHCWVEWVIERASRPAGPAWPSDAELQGIYAELGAPWQRPTRQMEIERNRESG